MSAKEAVDTEPRIHLKSRMLVLKFND
jgi:hypothetical protein